jgi:hypothetical protein
MGKKMETLIDKIKPYAKRKILDRAAYITDFLDIRPTLRELRQIEEAIKRKKGKRTLYQNEVDQNKKFLARPPPFSEELDALKKQQLNLAREMDESLAENLRLHAWNIQADLRLSALNYLVRIQETEIEEMAIEASQEAEIAQVSEKNEGEEEFVRALEGQLMIFDSTLEAAKRRQRSPPMNPGGGDDSDVYAEDSEEESVKEPELNLAGIVLPPVPKRVPLIVNRTRLKVGRPQVTIGDTTVIVKPPAVQPPTVTRPSMAGVRICHLFQFSMRGVPKS